MTQTVLLTGISGFIAKHVAARLLHAGHRVRGSLRRMDRAEEVRTALRPVVGDAALERLSFLALDLEQDAGWPQALAGCDALLHTASPFPIVQPEGPAVLIRPAVEGTLRALRAAHAAGVTRVVLTSSTAAILNRSKTRFDETDWCDPDAPGVPAYTRSKTLAERAAWEFATAHGLHLTTINPGLVLGPPMDGNFGSSVGLVRRLLRGKDPMMPDVGFPVVDVRDVAEAHLRALDRPETAGLRIPAVAGSLTMPQMGRELKRLYPNRRIPTRTAPVLLLRLLSVFDRSIRTILPDIGHHPQVSNDRARQALDLRFTSAEGALRATAEWLVKEGKV